MEAGFYKAEQLSVLGDATLLYAPNFVLNKDYELRIEQREEYAYPVHGWYYFESELDARLFFEQYYELED